LTNPQLGVPLTLAVSTLLPQDDKETMRDKLLARKLLRQQLSQLNKVMLTHNAVERMEHPLRLTTYRAAKGLTAPVQRTGRWRHLMTMFKMTRVFFNIQQNEVSS
jgi:hypothetical protein